MLYAEEVDALAEATAVDVTEEGRVELWQFCRAATGLDGEALSSVLSNLDKEDADMLSALRATCATWEPNKVAKVVRALLRWLRDDVGLVPLDKPVVEPTTAGPGRAPKRARPYGSVGVLQKSTEELAEYKHSRYVAKQQDMMQRGHTSDVPMACERRDAWLPLPILHRRSGQGERRTFAWLWLHRQGG